MISCSLRYLFKNSALGLFSKIIKIDFKIIYIFILSIMEFQIYDFVEDHEKIEEEDESDSECSKDELPEYIIHVFGRTLDDKSVYCRVRNFTPHFYIRLPSSWSHKSAKSKIKIMEEWFKSFQNKKVWKKYREGLIDIDLVSKKDAIGFTNDKEYLFARLVFNNSYAMKKYRYMIEQNKLFIPRVTTKNTQFKTYEANLLSMLRCFHIKKVSGCSWVRIEKYEEITFEPEKMSYCDIELMVDWRNLIPIEKDCNAPLRIASFDIECTSVDGQFPMARRKSDQVIQIGTTYTKLGESIPYRQHIVCLDTTDPVEGAVTEWYSDERDLILAWKKEIIKSDCDILTGYNIFFFDEKYIYDRCDLHLGLKIEISMLSKLKNRECNFRDFKLASSAMGENLIRYWDTPGRVHVDLMKDVQKTYNLSSYKLDDVASNFIRGKIEKFDKKYNKKKDHFEYTLYCANVDDIYDNDYIHVEHVKSFVSDYVGHKYLIDSVDKENKTLTFTSDADIEEVDEGCLFWSQAKDDVTAQDIFNLQKGSSADRSIVAKYCVKDCRLVNVLVNKLEVVTKNIEMANVCYVPFSYLFVRGQGVKLFSLCLKVYREHGYLFPVVTKPKEDDGGYEGAIVFDPIPSVYYEPLVTKDYASLYPSSILQKNMSHETMVRSSDYDELEDIEYYNAQYKQNDGNIKHVRFAKKDGKLGVVPTILDTLLKERKSVKKQMKVEKDNFKYKILDAKQLALKITANSLYGQLGAPTSPVYMKAIAACTTSTGREMLNFAKKYDEEILPGFMNGLKYAYKNKDEKMLDRLLQMEVKGYEPGSLENNKLVAQIKDFVTDKTKDYIFNPTVRYGDSVIGDTPLLLKNIETNKIEILKIKDLANKWGNYHETKESCELNNYMTWTERGWTKIQRVIRHKFDSENKKLLKIATHTGVVVVTDEHSLLDENRNMIDASKVNVGSKLLHSFPEISNDNTFEPNIRCGDLELELSEETAYVLGFFMGDGSCGYYENCDKSSFAFNNKDINVLKYIEKVLNESYGWNEYNWKILDTLESSNVYKLVPSKKSTDYPLVNFIKSFRQLFYNDEKEKIVPNFILNSSKDIRYGFWVGLYDADGFKTNYGSISRDMYDDSTQSLKSKIKSNKIRCGQQIDQKGTAVSLGIYYLAKSLGYSVSINCRDDKKNIYRIRVSDKLRKDPIEIKRITDWKYEEEYVYDLTTENHHFHAGVGSIIVHNTDSVFTCFRFREGIKKVKEKKSLKLLKKIMKFGKKLIMFFMPEEHKEMFSGIFDEYYGKDKIDGLRIPTPPDVLPEPDHWNVLLPMEERMKQFIKEYMEESYLPWMWTLQDLFNEFRKKFSDKEFDELLIPKLYNWADYLIERMRISSYNVNDIINGLKDEIDPIKKDIREEKKKGKLKDQSIIDELEKEVSELEKEMNDHIETKNTFIEYIATFFKEDLSKIWVEPYWELDEDMNRTVSLNFWKKGKSLTDKRGLDLSIELGIISGDTVKKRLPFPHDLEYEKTFWPYLILTKKRYVGNKYEFDNNKFKQDFMGIVLKRRDNAPIVKEICNGIIDSLINYKDPKRAKKFTRKCLKDMFANKFDINYFLTSKTLKLKESYKDWTKIAHVVLAERIGIRDPGNKPQSGDRISFAAIKIDNKDQDTLQGDMIETPEFIKENNIELDYLFYMTNQIMNPAMQFLELVSKDAEDIFNVYIYKDKLEELQKEQIELTQFFNENETEIPKDLIGGSQTESSSEVEAMKEMIDIYKKQNRKLKNLQKKVIKEKLEAEVKAKMISV